MNLRNQIKSVHDRSHPILYVNNRAYFSSGRDSPRYLRRIAESTTLTDKISRPRKENRTIRIPKSIVYSTIL